MKCTNLSEELIFEYVANHRLFQYPSKERPPKMPKIHGPQRLSLDPARSSPAGLNLTYVLELLRRNVLKPEAENKFQRRTPTTYYFCGSDGAAPAAAATTNTLAAKAAADCTAAAATALCRRGTR